MRVFDWDGSSWSQVGPDIDGNAANDAIGTRSGLSLSSDGSRIAIGAKDGSNGTTQTGYVKIYDLVGNNWVQVGPDIKGDYNQHYFGVNYLFDGHDAKLMVGYEMNELNEGATSADADGFRARVQILF